MTADDVHLPWMAIVTGSMPNDDSHLAPDTLKVCPVYFEITDSKVSGE